MLKKGWYKKFTFNADTGFGNTANNQGERLVNQDGSFNVSKGGMPFFNRINLYHDLIKMPWWKFNLWVLMSFLVVNLLFTCIYMTIGVEEFTGVIGESLTDIWFEMFTFSTQTFSTVGYGRINPIGKLAGSLAALEGLIGLMLAAILTGLVFSRFSRPKAMLAYSKIALIAPFGNINALMFRIANMRDNQLVECEGEVLFSFIEAETNMRRFITLPLERKRVTGLPLSWTIVHPIDDDSPMKGLTEKELKEMDAEFIFIFKAFDDTYAQNVYTRHSYQTDELVWGAKFTPMFRKSDKHNGTELLINKINDYIPTKLNEN